MDAELRAYLRGALDQVAIMAAPVRALAADPRRAYAFLHALGWDLPGLLGPRTDALTAAATAVAARAAEVRAAADAADVPGVVAAAEAAIRAAYEAVHGLRDALVAGTVPDLPAAIADALTRDVVDALAIAYVRRAWPLAARVAAFLGLIVDEVAAPLAHAGVALRHPVRRPATRLAAIVAAAADPLGAVLEAGATGGLAGAAGRAARELDALERELRARVAAGVTLRLGAAELALEGAELPLLSAGHGGFSVPLPLAHEPVLHATPAGLRVTWTPPPALAGTAPLVEVAGLRVLALGGDAAASVELRLGLGGAAATVRGGLRLELPPAVLAAVGGARVGVEAAGALTLSTTAAPRLVIARAATHVDGLALGGAGAALVLGLDGAELAVEGLELPPRPGAPLPAITARGTLQLAAGGHAHKLGAALRVELDPGAGTARLALTEVRGGLFRRAGTTGAAPDDYELALADGAATLTAHRDGVDLELRSGTLALPALFADAAGGRPAIALVPPGVRIAIRPGAPEPLALAGAFELRDLRVALDGLGEAGLDVATLELAGTAPPILHRVRGHVRAPLPGGGVLALSFGTTSDAAWSLGGLPLPAVELVLDEDAVLDLGGDLHVAVLGATAANPAYRTRLALAGAPPVLELRGGVELGLPLAALARHDGTRVTARAAATLRLAPGQPPQVSGLAVAIRPQPYLRLGGTGIAIHGELTADQLEHLLAPDATHPVVLGLTGGFRVGGDDGQDALGLAVEGARFAFHGTAAPPSFALDRLTVETGALRRVDGVPVRVLDPSLRFRAQLPLPALFAPDNVELGCTLEAGFEVGHGIPTAVARAGGVTIGFAANGLPERLTVRDVGFGLRGVDLGVMTVDAEVFAGDLPAPGPFDPRHPPRPPYFVGRGGGTVNGAGVGVLVAFGRPERTGVALDLRAGPSGIVLGQTGFVITGVAGGISFANSTRDPSELAAYIDDAGKPIEGALPPAAPRPAAEPAPATPAALDGATRFPCPGADCPPPSMNLLCQPHPVERARAILKGTSLGETDLRRIGLRRAEVNARFPAPTDADLAALAGDFVRRAVAGLAPLGGTLPAAVQARLAAARDSLVAWAIAELRRALAARPPTTFDALLAVAALGLPCPDVTLQVTGTGSHLAVSTFLSITGGFRVSTAGAVGVLGSVNVFGVPVGKLWGFLTGTDAQGDPDVGLCGVVLAAVGPLELGALRFAFACRGCVTGIAGAVRDLAAALGPALVRAIVAEVAPAALTAAERAAGAPPPDPAALLGRLDDAALLGVLAALYRRPITAELRAALVALVHALWDRFQPEVLLCGAVRPRFFGIPLMPDAVAVRARITKQDYAVQVAFAPSLLLTCLIDPRYLPPFDSAELGFRTLFPETIAADLLLRSGGRALGHPDTAAALAASVLDELLATFTVAGRYSFAPLGVELAAAEARLMMPDLVHHPDRPGGAGFTPPEARGLSSRVEVLVAAVGEKLGSPLWRGTAAELAALTPPPGAAPLRTGGLALRDYFPHGGLAGGARLPIPRLLYDAPDLALLGAIADPAGAPVERCRKLLEFVDRYLAAAPASQGGLAFYVPAPVPPFVRPDGVARSPRELVEQMAGRFPALADVFTSPGYPRHLGFCRGWLHGQLLGVPLGNATLDVVPVAGGAPGAGGRLAITAELPAASWLGPLVRGAGLTFLIDRPASGKKLDAVLAPIRARAAALRDAGAATAADAGALSAQLAAALAHDAPRVSLEARVQLQAAALAPLLAPDPSGPGPVATLHAYSAGFDPGAAGDGPIAEARRRGGIALKLERMRLSAGAGIELAVPAIELAVTRGTGGAPSVRGRIALPPLRFGALRVHGAAGPSEPLAVTLTEAGLEVAAGARLAIDGATGTATLAAFTIGRTGDLEVATTASGLALPAGSLGLAVASATLRRTGGTAVLRVDGAAATGPAPIAGSALAAAFEIASSGQWSASARFATAATLVDAPAARVTAKGAAIRLGRDAAGPWAELTAQVAYLGVTAVASARLGANGALVLPLPAATLALGPFELASDGGTAALRIGDAANVEVRLGGVAVALGAIERGAGHWGWKASDVAIRFGPSANLAFQPGDVRFADMKFAAWTIARRDGAVTAETSDAVTVLGATMTRTLRISSAGAVSGTLRGQVKVDFTIDPPRVGPVDPPPYTRTIDFGTHDIGFDPASRRYVARLEASGFRYDFAWP